MKNFYKTAVACCLKLLIFFFLQLPFTVSAQESMRANLYVVDANGLTLVDGNLTNYNNIYSNSVDINDGWKLANPGINFGIYRSSINLAVERRSVYVNSDTTFFRMWNMLQVNYSIKLMLSNLNHPGMRGFIKDTYLNTETTIGLNDTTYYNFSVDANPASKTEMRFQLIYVPAMVLPLLDVNFTGVFAKRSTTGAVIRWDVASETLIQSYTVERSTDGRNFVDLQNVVTHDNNAASKSYTFNDAYVPGGDIFYRVKALSQGGRIQYSAIAKINSIERAGNITVYPNPVMDKIVQLQLGGMAAGKYDVTLLFNNGSQQRLSSFQISEGQKNTSLNLPQNIAAGIYQLRFAGPGIIEITKNIVVL